MIIEDDMIMGYDAAILHPAASASAEACDQVNYRAGSGQLIMAAHIRCHECMAGMP